jgi:hypothetical protein
MADQAQTLQEYWTKLRDVVQVQNSGVITDAICMELARKILSDCFRDSSIERSILLWWFERSVLEIRNRIFAHSYQPQHAHLQMLTPLTIQGINQIVINCGLSVRTQLCSDSKNATQVKHHAITYLSRQNDAGQPGSASQQALQAVSRMEPDAIGKLLDKKPHIYLQAAAVMMCFLRDDMPGISRCLLPTQQSFEDRYANVIIRDNSRLLDCFPHEKRNLYFTCNLMRIAYQFIPAQRGKGLYVYGCIYTCSSCLSHPVVKYRPVYDVDHTAR